MSQKVSVPVWFDESNQFCAGQLMGVGADARVVGYVDKPSAFSVPGSTVIPALKPTLFVKDKDLGGLYLDMTLEEWEQAAANTAIAPAVWGGGPGGSQNLQQVTANGKTTTIGIDYVDGSGNVLASVGSLLGSSNGVSAWSTTGDQVAAFGVDTIGQPSLAMIESLSGLRGTIIDSNATAINSITAPDESGTFALQRTVSSYVVVDAGNVIGALMSFGNVLAQDGDYGVSLIAFPGGGVTGLQITIPGAGMVLKADNVTTARVLQAPDSSGTIALTAGSGIATLSSGSVNVADAAITATSVILVTPVGAATPQGLSITRNAGVGFSIDSSNIADSRDVCYYVIRYV